jgi:hypothetical protein
MMENSPTHESLAPAFSTRTAKSSGFEKAAKAWNGAAAVASSWGDLRIDPRPLLQKIWVTFAAPLANDLHVGDSVTLPAARTPLSPTGIYALAINRYKKLLLSEDGARIEHVAAELSKREDILLGDASCAISSAVVSGEHAAEMLARAAFVDVANFADGEYARMQFGHSVVIVHKYGDAFWLHWPETLTEYMCGWWASVTSIERD